MYRGRGEGMREEAAVTLGAEDVRTLATLAGLNVRDDDLAPIAQRLTATLLELTAVSDAALVGIEPKFVHPLPSVASP
jgi:hypothetical protein